MTPVSREATQHGHDEAMAPLWSDQRLITTFATFEQMPKNSSSSPRAPYSFDLTAIVQKKCRNLLSCTMCSTILHLLGLRCDCQCICVGLSHHLPRRHEHRRNFCVICSRSLSCTFELRSVVTSSESFLLPSSRAAAHMQAHMQTHEDTHMAETATAWSSRIARLLEDCLIM